MKWVTREKAKVDRIACPWLIKNFIDKDAEFLFVPTDQVLTVAEKEQAISFDAANAKFTHTQDGKCTFEVLVEHYKIDDPAVQKLAKIVHGADVPKDVTLTPESAGLQTIAEG
ncbi:chromate resistance protein, partial [Candidatus Gottesmanbacteria bacterium]|nr:chromate resistance protein [Candidatus Gottesmanbacteria bacterium]